VVRSPAAIESFALQPWPRRIIAWSGALFIAAIVAMAAWDIVRSYEAAVDDTGRELHSQARVIAEQTARSVQAVDVMLRHVAGEYHRGRLARLSPDELHAYLRELSVGLVQIGGFGLYDASGNALAQSWLEPGRMRDISELPGFKALRDDPRIAFGIGNATRSADDGHWIMPLGRRLESRDGQFAGIVGAIGSIDYFQDFYRDARFEPGTTITLMHRRGNLLARFPPLESALGKRYVPSGALASQRTQGAHGAVRVTSQVDGVERFAVLLPVPDLPLEVIVSRDVESALAPWRVQAQRTVLTTLALALMASLLLAVVWRQFRRLYTVHRSLEASRERFELAAAGSDDGIWDWELASGRVYVSARARELFGVAPGAEPVSRDEWFANCALHPDDAAARKAAIEAHMAGLTPAYVGEYRVARSDGGYRWIRVRGLCVRDASGVALRMAGSVNDIDARKRAEDALRESEERYALAMAGSNEGHWVWDVAIDQFYASPMINRIYGLPATAQLTTMSAYFAQLPIHPDDRERLQNFRAESLANDSSHFELEYRILRPDGEVRWLFARGQCFRDAAGKPERFAGSVLDVTKKKRMQEALRESEERFALAVAGSDDGVWDWDFVADRAFESARARELQGLPPGPQSQPLPELLESLRVHPEDAQRRAEALRAHLAGETPAYECEYRVRHDDGAYRWIRVRALGIRDAAGKPVRIAGSVSDIDARKRTEDSLRESEERYALAMAGSSGGYWVWEVDSDALFGSGNLNQLFGLPEELHPTTRSAYFSHVRVHADDWAQVRQVGDDFIAGRAARADFEYRILLPEGGEVRWIMTRAQCFNGHDGKPVRVAGVSVDVTERKRIEEALRESEERFTLAVAGSKDGIVDWDISSKRMFASERALEIAGIAPGQEIRTCDEWMALAKVHPDDAERECDDFRQQLEGQSGIHEGEYRFLQPDGGYRWVRVRGTTVRDASGKAVRWAGSLSDIDALKQTEQALRRSEERYSLAVAGSNQGLWDWDLESDTLFLSARAQEFMGLAPSEPLRPRREWIALSPFHPDDRPLVRKVISAHLRGETAHYSVEYRLRHASGRWRWHRQRGIALRDAEGRPYRVAGSMEDITDRKDTEAQRDALQGQLLQAKKLEAIGTLAGGIAHDFNNILSAILGYGEMAHKDAPESSAQRRHIEAAMSAGMRAKSLVERILAFSRSGMGERAPVHVQSVVGEALDAIAASLPAGVELVRRLDADDAAVLGDPTQVHQVVMNLCANAVQAMKGNGTLTVTLELADEGCPRCATSVLATAKLLRLAVRDTGVGIAPDLLERIFDPFFTTKEVGVGTGLGLSLVHGIVTDLGGGIDVQSKIGVGSTFTVYLPWQCADMVATPPHVEEAVPVGAGETILLVDDEEPLVRLGEELIAQLGYEPVGFTSSKAALAAFRAEPQRFDAVLSDEAMPEMTGSEFVRQVRALRPDLPVVLMSGYVTAQLAARAREAGVAEVLGKPLAARDIARALAAALRQPPLPSGERDGGEGGVSASTLAASRTARPSVGEPGEEFESFAHEAK
jgi:PAS domain S-box-containing protein